ncbi:hypothetical protein [Saccharothrix sp. HUAS TT1]|uniref:hypothetical protein n=1 Tax=unclassified Saccharothrix TaxID=2593673 RepID=UPI00345BD84C
MESTPSPGELLDPRQEVVPLLGREDELAALARWRDGDGMHSVLLLHGPAGVGKTRLAEHFAAGTAVRVVDDADLLPWADLHHLLQQPVHAADGRTRFLLVARTAGWWWSATRQRAADLDHTAADLAITARPAEHEDPFAAACAHFATALGRPYPTAPAPTFTPAATFAAATATATATAAATATADTDTADTATTATAADPATAATAAPTTATAATDADTDTATAAALDTAAAPTAATLTGTAAPTATTTAPAALAEPAAPPAATWHDLHLAAVAAVHGSPADDPVELVRWLINVDPNPPTRGRLAEDVLAVTLLDERIAPEHTPDALETLLRAAERWPHARRRAEELFTAHPELANTATSATLRALVESPGPAKAVARHVFDDPRFHGDPLPAVLTRTLLDDRARAGAGKLELAELHGVLSARAALAALREEALAAARHEVALYRELAEEDPADHRPALADALGDLSLRHIAVNRPEDALAAAEEAVALCRVIAAEDDDCTAQLAGALDQLSLRYAALGRCDDATIAVGEASGLYRDLAAAHPAWFRVEQAKVTHHHAVRLFEAGRGHEAAYVSRLAVEQWREVAESDPRYQAEFARTLGSIAALLAARNRRDEALVVLRESVEALRRLARANPRDFEPELASALGAQSAVLRALDRPADAVRASEEAVLVCRRAARDGDPTAVAQLAGALGDLVGALTGPECLAVAEEAVELLRPLAARSPADHRAPFAIAQARLVRPLLAAGREYEARRVVDEVLSVCPELPHRLLVVHGAGLAAALGDLADDLAEHDHRRLALRPAGQVAGIWRDLLGRDRSASTGYAVAVHRTAVLTRGREALDRARHAVLVWHLTRTPDELADDPRYADALLLCARLCAESGRHVEHALSLAHRAVVVLHDSGAAPDLVTRAAEAVDAVVRAHADPEAARARMRTMTVSPW